VVISQIFANLSHFLSETLPVDISTASQASYLAAWSPRTSWDFSVWDFCLISLGILGCPK